MVSSRQRDGGSCDITAELFDLVGEGIEVFRSHPEAVLNLSHELGRDEVVNSFGETAVGLQDHRDESLELPFESSNGRWCHAG